NTALWLCSIWKVSKVKFLYALYGRPLGATKKKIMRHIIAIVSLFLTMSLSSQTCEKSRIESFLNDPDTTGTNLRNSPNGEIIYVIKNNMEMELIVTFEIIDSQDNWLFIKTTYNGNQPEKRGWIYGGLVSVNTRNYEGQNINLYSKPNKISSVKNILKGERTVSIIDVCGQWAYVRFRDESGNSIEGWLEPEMQCGSPYTTCC
uniref:SH3 domain-containing protein n=1 Tax=Carboxylicivirga marina TaxID=2800988 RepID=UPI00259A829A